MSKNIALLILLLCTCVRAQQVMAQHESIKFEATTDKQKMFINGTVRYQVTLTNAQGTDLEVPDFKGFTVVSGPSRSISTQNFNGAFSSTESVAWLLQPKREGKLTIGPAKIRANGRGYRTNSKQVEVLPVDADALNAAPDNFLRADISTTTAFVGQQIILDLNLYTSEREASRNLTMEPDFDGFFAQPRRQYDGRPRAVIENGREYQRRTLGSLALFPTKSGRLTISPYRMILGTRRYYGTGANARRRVERIPLATDTIFLDVSELPKPRPANFSGGVGTYRYQVQANRNDMTTDDALTFKVTITGEGDIQRVEGAPPVSKKDWDIYDPTILEEDFLDSPTGMLGRKTLEYKVVPKRSGVYRLNPGLTYFDVDSARYVTLSPTEFNVTVTGEDRAVDYSLDTLATTTDELALRPATSLPAGRTYGGAPADNWPYWLLFFLPVLAAGGAIGWQRYREHLSGRDPNELAYDRAARAATRRLKSAKTHLDNNEPKLFYDAVQDALLGYLRNKFSLATTDLSRRNIREQLSAAGADASITQEYDDLLQRCEVALYAGQDSFADLRDTYQTATELITRTEKAVG